MLYCPYVFLPNCTATIMTKRIRKQHFTAQKTHYRNVQYVQRQSLQTHPHSIHCRRYSPTHTHTSILQNIPVHTSRTHIHRQIITDIDTEVTATTLSYTNSPKVQTVTWCIRDHTVTMDYHVCDYYYCQLLTRIVWGEYDQDRKFKHNELKRGQKS